VARLQLGAQKRRPQAYRLFDDRESPCRVQKGGAKRAVLRLICVKLRIKFDG
jgi:hypothetical protein